MVCCAESRSDDVVQTVSGREITGNKKSRGGVPRLFLICIGSWFLENDFGGFAVLYADYKTLDVVVYTNTLEVVVCSLTIVVYLNF